VSRRRKTSLRAIGCPSANTPTLDGSQSRGFNDLRDLRRTGDAPETAVQWLFAVFSGFLCRIEMRVLSCACGALGKIGDAGNVVPTASRGKGSLFPFIAVAKAVLDFFGAAPFISETQ